MRLTRLMRRRDFFQGVPLSCKIAFACTPTFACLAHFATLLVFPRKARSVLLHSSKVQRSAYPPTQEHRVARVEEACHRGCLGSLDLQPAAAETCTHRSGELLPSADAQRSVWPRAAQKSRVSSMCSSCLIANEARPFCQQAASTRTPRSSHFHCGGRLPLA
jgi:hypothetical protein